MDTVTVQTVTDGPINWPTPPTSSAPSIQSSAMIVEFSTSVWVGRKKDKSASAQITIQNNAASGTANVSKKLLGDCAELDAIQKFVGTVRKHHYALTMPWSDMGQRLIPTAMFFDYQNQMSAFEQEFDRLVQAFLDVYDWEIIQSRVKLGDLFNDADYAPVHDLRRKFAFNVTYSPVPEAGDFRVDMGNEQAAILKTQYQEHYEAQITKAMDDVFKRTRTYLERLHNSLDDDNISMGKDGKPKPKRIFAGTFDGVLDMIDMLKACNLTGDTQMEAIRIKLEDQFRGLGRIPLSAEALREDKYLRAETKSVVEDVIKNLPTIDL
jgi:hypothetical protein